MRNQGDIGLAERNPNVEKVLVETAAQRQTLFRYFPAKPFAVRYFSNKDG